MQNGEAYDFYQAIRLLSRLTEIKGQGDSDLPPLRIHPELSLDYPYSDIKWIKERAQGQGYEMETTFFGLYGVSSPLPGFYTEELFDDEWEEETAARGFLDVIHHRLYPLLYQAWLKYRFTLNAVEQDRNDYWEIIFSLVGLSEEFRGKIPDSGRLLKYTGIISQQPRSQLGLKTILNDLISDLPISIEPCVERQVKVIPQQRCLMGSQNHQLGHNSVLGEYVVDRTGKFSITIGPLNQDDFNRVASDDALMQTIRGVTQLFLVKPLLFDIRLILEQGAETPICLGDESRASLGKNTWLGVSSSEEQYQLVMN